MIVAPLCTSWPGASNDTLLCGLGQFRMMTSDQGQIQVKATRVTKLLGGCRASLLFDVAVVSESIDGSTDSPAKFERELLAKKSDCNKQPQ